MDNGAQQETEGSSSFAPKAPEGFPDSKEKTLVADEGAGDGGISVVHRIKAQSKRRLEAISLLERSPQDPAAIALFLRRTTMALDAKRSQLRTMQRIANVRIVGKLISPAYLDEVASEILWYEAVIRKLSAKSQDITAANQRSEEVPKTVREVPGSAKAK